MSTTPDLCLGIASGKPGGDLILRVFQRYFAKLCTALSTEPNQMAREMFSEGLISEETMRRVVEMREPSTDKAGVLVQAIGNRIAVEGNSKAMKAFCELLKGRPEVRRIAARIKARLGE